MMHELLDPVSFGPKMKSWPSCSCSSFYGGYILRLEITPPHSLAFWLYKSALWQIIYVSTRTRLYMFPLFFTRLYNPIDFNNYICFHMSNTLCFTRLYMFPLFFWQIFAYNWYSKLLRQAVVRKIYHPSLPVWSWLITTTKYLQSSKIPSFNLNKASSLVTAWISTPFAYNWYKQTVETLYFRKKST